MAKLPQVLLRRQRSRIKFANSNFNSSSCSSRISSLRKGVQVNGGSAHRVAHKVADSKTSAVMEQGMEMGSQ